MRERDGGCWMIEREIVMEKVSEREKYKKNWEKNGGRCYTMVGGWREKQRCQMGQKERERLKVGRYQPRDT